MNVLNSLTTAQELKIIPRDYTAGSGFTVILIEDGTGKKETIEGVSGQVEGNYFKLTVAFSILTVNSIYSIEVRSSSDYTIYKGKIFCSNRSNKLSKPSLNTNLYVQHTASEVNQKYIMVDGGSTDELAGGAGTPGGGGGDNGGGGTPSGVTLLYDEAEMAALTSPFQICDLYGVSIDSVEYNDWYLPSFKEAQAMVSNLALVNEGLADYGYDKVYEPTIVGTPSGPVQTNRYYWTSTENEQFPTYAFGYQVNVYGNTIRSLDKDIDETCFLSETECRGLYELYYKFRVRPVRFEPGVDGDANYSLDGYGGVIAAGYTLNGVEGALIISPTEPLGADTYVKWSDLSGETTTGADSETDGAANCAIVLALENA